MKKAFLYIVLLIMFLPSVLMAEAVGSSSLLINGVVAPKSIFGLTGYFDVAPNAVRLDEGDILLSAGYNRWIGLALQRSSHLSFARGSGSMAKNLIP